MFVVPELWCDIKIYLCSKLWYIFIIKR